MLCTLATRDSACIARIAGALVNPKGLTKKMTTATTGGEEVLARAPRSEVRSIAKKTAQELVGALGGSIV